MREIEKKRKYERKRKKRKYERKRKKGKVRV